MIYVTGDTHGEIDIYKLGAKYWKQGNSLTKEDYVIILGDFGLLWFNDKTDKYWQKWLTDKPWTTLFIDGNHENFNLIEELETVEKFGTDVGKLNDSIYHLRRGRIYDIDGNKCFVLGGAESTDRKNRIEGKSWWSQEAITVDDIILSLKNLEAIGNKVDYVFTHTAPIRALYDMSFKGWLYEYGDKTRTFDPACYQLQQIAEKIEFKHWYFGHLHEDKSIINCFGQSKYTCLYEDIIKLGSVIDNGW